jgi:hypothetical protein
MKKEDFQQYLEQNGCVLVRVDNRGYSIYRNVLTGMMSGVPATDPCYPATMCRICKTLGIEPPECAHAAIDIIEKAHKQHGRKQ